MWVPAASQEGMEVLFMVSWCVLHEVGVYDFVATWGPAIANGVEGLRWVDCVVGSSVGRGHWGEAGQRCLVMQFGAETKGSGRGTLSWRDALGGLCIVKGLRGGVAGSLQSTVRQPVLLKVFGAWVGLYEFEARRAPGSAARWAAFFFQYRAETKAVSIVSGAGCRHGRVLKDLYASLRGAQAYFVEAELKGCGDWILWWGKTSRVARLDETCDLSGAAVCFVTVELRELLSGFSSRDEASESKEVEERSGMGVRWRNFGALALQGLKGYEDRRGAALLGGG
ncbi:hypothetical protein EPH_0052790 [Eimeria praecox]|uniref:Uncharacterized protein n=1 Tax=Eimeria praecox TaxID=51316 RepID=U6GZX3_9EIME|nr:hypothetical protein EPH_0052790 [Eimeria praecox]